MMAHSFKDPLWRAVMEHEVQDNPGLQSFIENKCQSCHAPLARTQAFWDGTNELAFANALTSPLAGEGVGCTLCHQIQNTDLGEQASFTGRYRIGTNRFIFGPYEEVLTMPMRRHVDYTPVHGAHTQDSALCATCHTLFTPIVTERGKVVGEFAEQVPYLEWKNSAYAEQGRHCQDCHMPRMDTPVKVSRRPPWLEPRAPFWQHQFVGGNAFMLELFATQEASVKPNADAALLQTMAGHAREQLKRAARLQVTSARETNLIVVHVTVENLTGHKFPTGHPFRRAWLHVRILDARGQTLFASGTPDERGAISAVQNGYAPHYDIVTKPGEVQIYQSVMADANGAATWSLLRGASYLKDNRIPPRGFTTASVPPEVAVHGAAMEDPNFNLQGGGRDEVTYRIAVPDPVQAMTVRVELLYQSVPPEAVAHLLRSKLPEAATFAQQFSRQKNEPEVVQEVEMRL